MSLARGSVVLVDLEPTLGHEQRGVRPCVIVSDPDVAATLRFPLVCVVPVTGTAGNSVLCPRLAPGPSGLKKESFALVDQVRSIDKRRIRRAYGILGADELAALDEGLALYLGLN
jgi:mRNA interferase MazF